jgi:hypothetical protein
MSTWCMSLCGYSRTVKCRKGAAHETIRGCGGSDRLLDIENVSLVNVFLSEMDRLHSYTATNREYVA